MDGWPFDLEYTYDSDLSRQVRGHAKDLPGRLQFSYFVKDHKLFEEATIVLSLEKSLEHSESILDLTENYIWVQSLSLGGFKPLASVDVEIGRRTFHLLRCARRRRHHPTSPDSMP